MVKTNVVIVIFYDQTWCADHNVHIVWKTMCWNVMMNKKVRMEQGKVPKGRIGDEIQEIEKGNTHSWL